MALRNESPLGGLYRCQVTALFGLVIGLMKKKERLKWKDLWLWCAFFTWFSVSFCSLPPSNIFHSLFGNSFFFTVVSLGYALIRYFKPAGAPAGNLLPSAADLLDFLFVAALIYLTGGIRSFFHVAHAIPICGSAIRFGIWGGIIGFLLSLIITAAMFIAGGTSVSFPLPFHIIAGIGTLAFATWLVVILAEKEQQLHKKLYLSSITDSLTGLYNSAYLRERVREEIRRYQREGQPFTLAFLDLDGFKKVNDRRGHLASDGVLKQVAELLRKNTRGQELLVRYAVRAPLRSYGGRAYCPKHLPAVRVPEPRCGGCGGFLPAYPPSYQANRAQLRPPSTTAKVAEELCALPLQVCFTERKAPLRWRQNLPR